MSMLENVSTHFVRHAVSNDVISALMKSVTRRGLVPGRFWRKLPPQEQFQFSTPDGGSIIYSTVAGDQLARGLCWRGLDSVEPETTRVFYRLARKAKLVLDLGAYTGVYTLLACAANRVSTVIAFEPVPRIFERLVNHIRLNKLQGRCQLHNKAVSNIEGRLELHVPPSELPTSSSLTADGFRGVSGSLIDVEVTTIDTVIPEGARVDLMKLDVEWAEDKALEGASRVLSESRPTLIVECLPDGPYKAVEAITRELGYHCYDLRRSGPVLVDHIVPHPDNDYRNFLFTVHDTWDKLF